MRSVLTTTHFRMPGYQHVRSTPVRHTGWVVVWQLSPAKDRQVDMVVLGDPTA